MSTTNSNPIALITGGSRGLGRSMALHLADRGVDVILTYQTAEKEAREVAAMIEARGRRAAILRLDVGRSDTFTAFAASVKAELGRVWKRERFDFLVNNAGNGGQASFAETTEEQFDALMNVHLKGPFFLSQKLLPLIADGGRIVNVSSGLARYTFPGSSVYAAAKGGVEVLTRYMARELGARGITVNVVAPGGIETDFGGGVMRDPELQKFVTSQTALGRVGMPDDIGGIVAMLLAPETRWLTGQRLEVTGGFAL
ncbi:SDR family oxidoreductase [Pyxidicoccus fallax]|uniref:SDR family oxidoreductase n=1 Tax=Pyxidicoccus fallax TaxID=394095 RepID=A0A848L703_9BACT|nr:SDR family oxidoreductase [Pyxidicoccus fallax]NMO14760.1 SDR family oxidoreductase [Pyxidicoccus fallax]NPC82347.1 SDR family oxidoreductase [Pyxidicoccus fallax]